MKTGFERAYQALAGYDFADAESRENALWALHWAHQARNTLVGHTFRPPLVIITGISGTGKTRLAAKLSDNDATYGCDSKVGMILNRVADRAVPVAVVDNVQPKSFADKDLERFLSSEVWSLRKLHSKEAKERPLRTLLIFTAPELPDLSEDLKRRAVVIRLELSPHARQCESALSLLRSERKSLSNKPADKKLRAAFGEVIGHIGSIRFAPF